MDAASDERPKAPRTCRSGLRVTMLCHLVLTLTMAGLVACAPDIAGAAGLVRAASATGACIPESR